MRKLFHRVIKHISPTLEMKGFHPPRTQSPTRYYGAIEYIWLRAHGWKNDKFRLSHREGSLRLDFSCLVTYHLQTEDSEETNEHIMVAEGIGSIGRPTLFFVAFRENLMLGKALRLVEHKIGWFDTFSTPDKCLSFLEKAKQELKSMNEEVNATIRAKYNQDIEYICAVQNKRR